MKNIQATYKAAQGLFLIGEERVLNVLCDHHENEHLHLCAS